MATTGDRGGAPEPASRRRFLRGAGITLGAAAAALPVFARAAGARQGTDTTGAGGADTTAPGAAGSTTVASTTTTSAPRRAEPEDLEFLAFAQSIELAIVESYTQMLGRQFFDEDTTRVARVFQQHHQEYADAVAGMAGTAGPGRLNQAYLDELSTAVQGAADQNALLEVGLEIEEATGAMYVQALGSLIATEPVALIGSIAPVSGRRAVVLGEAIGLPLDDYVPDRQSTAGAPTPAGYPIDEDES